ncbi:hypothetical protein CDAR_604581 [Caerostris darwini]|uniref:Uncharacterized protein n=1 Tax=Caerostris darwini TaxID=1538125 RepID=A0AAV4MV31_9ARAC|nr:hypothetical protein CDAR_604581 [Caerostris darwini]
MLLGWPCVYPRIDRSGWYVRRLNDNLRYLLLAASFASDYRGEGNPDKASPYHNHYLRFRAVITQSVEFETCLTWIRSPVNVKGARALEIGSRPRLFSFE